MGSWEPRHLYLNAATRGVIPRAVLVLVALLSLANHAAGALSMSATSTTASPGSGGAFEIDLNDPTASSDPTKWVLLNKFTLTVTVPANSGIKFGSATTTTSAPFIFTGFSRTTYTPVINPSQVSLSLTGQAITPVSVPIGNTPLGLVDIAFTTDNSTALGAVNISITSSSVQDFNGFAMASNTPASGTINVLPEPSPLGFCILPAVVGLCLRARGRRA